MNLLMTSLQLTTFEDIGTKIIDSFTRIVDAFVGMIIAIPNAIISVFEGWADIVGSTWYGPIIAAITIIGFILIAYFGFFLIDNLLQ